MTPSTSSCVAARRLPAPLADLRRITASGLMLAAFERSVYLDLDGRIVGLASAELAQGPLTISLQEFAPLRVMPAGADVTLSGGRLRLGAVEVDLRAASLWEPTLAVVGPARSGAAARDAAIDELMTGAPCGSIVPLLGSSPQGRPMTTTHRLLLEALGRGLDALGALISGRGHPEAVARIIGHAVAGRGPGLTPSGDDLLIGILYALVVWPDLVGAGRAPDVRALLVKAARGRTTRISAAYLEAAGRGWAAAPWHALVRSLDRAPEDARAAVRELLRIGETSGADALTGFCWAWRRVGT